MSGATGVLAGAAILGAGATVYGANKQASAQSDANAANAASVAGSDQSAWNSYLLSRGIQGNNAPTGTIPTDGAAVNTKLPLWANVTTTPAGGGVAKWVKKGTIPSAPTYRLAAPTASPTSTTAPTGFYAGGGNVNSAVLGGNALGGPTPSPAGAYNMGDAFQLTPNIPGYNPDAQLGWHT